MLTNSDAIIFGAFCLIVAEVIMIIKKVKLTRNLMIATFIMYLSVIISLLFFPIIFQEIGFDYNYNFVPFKTIIDTFENGTVYSIVIFLGNSLLLLPLGIFLRAAFNRKTVESILIILLIALLIEFLQFFIGVIIGYKYRCVDIDDFILNSIGGILGVFLYNVLPKKLKILINV